MNKRNAVLSQMAVLLEKEEQPYKRKISRSPTIPVVMLWRNVYWLMTLKLTE
jgi:hypothetical protein